jgi:hypothetical protein
MVKRFLFSGQFTIALTAVAVCLFASSVFAAEASGDGGSGKAHPVADAKKAGKEIGHGVKKTTKTIGHGFRDGTKAVGHETRKVTKEVGHTVRNGVHELEGKK